MLAVGAGDAFPLAEAAAAAAAGAALPVGSDPVPAAPVDSAGVELEVFSAEGAACSAGAGAGAAAASGLGDEGADISEKLNRRNRVRTRSLHASLSTDSRITRLTCLMSFPLFEKPKNGTALAIWVGFRGGVGSFSVVC